VGALKWVQIVLHFTGFQDLLSTDQWGATPLSQQHCLSHSLRSVASLLILAEGSLSVRSDLQRKSNVIKKEFR
jgi:hypothetical protein